MKSFSGPSDLRKYALALASILYTQGCRKESKLLEEAARCPCTTGGEWLSEISIACVTIKSRSNLPGTLAQKIEDLLEIVTSQNPYSE